MPGQVAVGSSSGKSLLIRVPAPVVVIEEDPSGLPTPSPSRDVYIPSRHGFPRRPNVQEHINEVSRSTIMAFDAGMSYESARTLGIASLREIDRLQSPNLVADFATRAAIHATSSGNAYNILRSALESPSHLDPYLSAQGVIRAVSDVSLRSFDRGISYQSSSEVGHAAFETMQRAAHNPVALYVQRAGAAASSSENTYKIMRAGLERPHLLDPWQDSPQMAASIARVAIAGFDKGLSYASAVQSGYLAIETIRQFHYDPTLEVAYQAAKRATSDGDAYRILRTALNRSRA